MQVIRINPVWVDFIRYLTAVIVSSIPKYTVVSEHSSILRVGLIEVISKQKFSFDVIGSIDNGGNRHGYVNAK
jgi:hypothetical protein